MQRASYIKRNPRTKKHPFIYLAFRVFVMGWDKIKKGVLKSCGGVVCVLRRSGARVGGWMDMLDVFPPAPHPNPRGKGVCSFVIAMAKFDVYVYMYVLCNMCLYGGELCASV